MAEYLIQDTTLDAIADAINEKLDTPVGAMTPAEMVTNIAAIPTGGGGGGGITLGEFASLAKPSGTFETDEVFEFGSSAFENRNVTVVHAPNATRAKNHCLKSRYGTQNMVITFFAPQSVVDNAGLRDASTALKTVVVKDISAGAAFIGDSVLETVDLQTGSVGTYSFQNCVALNKLILRSNSVQALGSNAFAGATIFLSGGTGGTVYIPKALYDHLGDGTANDYKSATNWSVYDGYGTITWAQIEGSQYDGYYAEGTPIPTT